jgi:hypothetical protein
MIPISIAVKLLDYIGGINLIGNLLSPIMEFVGLPGIMGLVWAVTIMTNLWSGALLYVVLSESAHVSTAQATILGIMMLMSHGLPIEVKMAHKCGVKVMVSLVMRLLSSFVLGYAFNFIFEKFSLFSTSATITLISTDSISSFTLLEWFLDQVKTYVIVLGLLFTLVLILDFLKKNGLVHHLGALLAPYLAMIGVSRKCASVTFVGMTLGLVYGSALLLEELDQGGFDDNDVLLSVTSMNLFHSIIEDTFIVVIMGAALFWVLPVRLLWTIAVMQSLRFISIKTRGRVLEIIRS